MAAHEEIDDEVEPIEQGSIDVEFVSTEAGPVLNVAIECPGVSDVFAEAALIERGVRRGELFQIPRVEPAPAPGSSYEGQIQLPYWVPSGPNQLAGFCPQLEEGRSSIDPGPVQFDLPEPTNGRWDSWKPTAPPSLGGETSADWVIDPDDRLEVQITEPTVVPFVATCGFDAAVDGARFIMWQRTLDGPVDLDTPFVAREFPVTYTETDDGIEIRADIEFEPGDGSPPEGALDEVFLTAICESTEPPFSPAAEPADEDAAVVLAIET